MKYYFLLLFGFFLLSSADVVEQKESIQWVSLEEAEQLQDEKPKKIMVFFETSWCSRCKQMDRTVFQDERVIATLNESFYAVRFDAEGTESLTFDGIEYNFDSSNGSRGAHEIAINMLEGFMAYPSVVFLNENKATIRKLVGVQNDDLFATFLNYLGEDAHLTQDWFEYSGQE